METPPQRNQSRPLAFIESNLTGTGMRSLCIARELGLRTVFLTSNLDRYKENMEAADTIRTQVDEIISCDTKDPETVQKALLSTVGRPLGVMSVMEHFIPVAAAAADLLGLPGLNPGAARTARDKMLTRTACSKNGVPAPSFRFVRSVDEVDSALLLVGLPCVIKPNDESGSRGVILCRTREEVLEQVADLVTREVNSKGQPRTPGGLIEECLFGHEVSVETFTHAGKTIVLGVTDKMLGPTPHFLEIGHTFPSMLPTERAQSAEALALSALEAIGFDFGPAHVEVKLTSQGPKLIEINARPAGDHITDLIRQSIGVSVLEESIKVHTGGVPDLAPRWKKGASIRFVTGRDGIVASVTGEDLDQHFPTLTDFRLTTAPGQETRWATNSLERLGYVMACGNSSYEAFTDASAASTHLTVAY